MGAKHTEGPWYVGKMPGWSGICVTRKPPQEYGRHGTIGDAPIAQVIDKAPHWETSYPVMANALLMAAAPDLLEALEALKGVVKDSLIPNLRKDVYFSGEVFAKVDAALAKAKGEGHSGESGGEQIRLPIEEYLELHGAPKPPGPIWALGARDAIWCERCNAGWLITWVERMAPDVTEYSGQRGRALPPLQDVVCTNDDCW